jgi:Fe-S cluster biogenesis protein NfuA
MFIQIEETPNPKTLKFLPGQNVSPESNFNFKNKDDAVISPLAIKMFEIQGVDSVFLGADFISITKDDSYEWHVLKPLVLTNIMDHLISGKDIVAGDASIEKKYDSEDAVIKEIVEILENRVRPAVAADGGDIIFHSYENGIVYLEMHGACSGCPSSTVTLKNGIENMLKFYIPEIISVEQIFN